MRPGRCSADLRNLRVVSFFRVSLTGSVHRGGSPGRSVKRASLTGTKRRKEGNALGNLGRRGGPLVLIRGGLKRRLRALGVDHGRRASLGEPGDGGTGRGGGGRSVSGRRPTSATRKMELNWEGGRAKCFILAGAATNEDVPA